MSNQRKAAHKVEILEKNLWKSRTTISLSFFLDRLLLVQKLFGYSGNNYILFRYTNVSPLHIKFLKSEYWFNLFFVQDSIKKMVLEMLSIYRNYTMKLPTFTNKTITSVIGIEIFIEYWFNLSL